MHVFDKICANNDSNDMIASVRYLVETTSVTHRRFGDWRSRSASVEMSLAHDAEKSMALFL